MPFLTGLIGGNWAFVKHLFNYWMDRIETQNSFPYEALISQPFWNPGRSTMQVWQQFESLHHDVSPGRGPFYHFANLRPIWQTLVIGGDHFSGQRSISFVYTLVILWHISSLSHHMVRLAQLIHDIVIWYWWSAIHWQYLTLGYTAWHERAKSCEGKSGMTCHWWITSSSKDVEQL
jgi:hypothetical protein